MAKSSIILILIFVKIICFVNSINILFFPFFCLFFCFLYLIGAVKWWYGINEVGWGFCRVECCLIFTDPTLSYSFFPINYY